MRANSVRACSLMSSLLLFSAALVACEQAPRPGRDAAGADSAAQAQQEAEPARPAGSDLLSLGPGAESRVYYQFTDAKGRVSFVERLTDVPEEWRDRVGYLELDAPPPLTPAAAEQVRASRRARSGSGTKLRFTAASATASTQQVTLYYADWCGYCRKAKAHLEQRGIAYDLRDVDIPAVSAELLAKTGSRSIPVIEVDGRILKGYSAEGLDRLLDGAS